MSKRSMIETISAPFTINHDIQTLIIFIMFDGIKLSAPKPVTMVKIISS